jgi:hypothetical protein
VPLRATLVSFVAPPTEMAVVPSNLNWAGLVGLFGGEFGETIATSAVGLFGNVSAVVATLKVLARYVAADGFVIPLIVSAAAAPAGNAHVLPASVTITVEVDPDFAPVAVQVLKPRPRMIEGVPGIPAANALLKATVIVSFFARAPVALAVKPTVQFAEAPAV